ncbi:MAG TPA: glycosyltransferase family A protein [Acidimicrobiales bacterium]|nr:glycosyltransferase family A protein [Acidimicrobiales bacterium]
MTVVIPTHNRRAFVVEAALSALTSSATGRVLVVDDGSADGTAELIRALDHPKVDLVRRDVPSGGSAARNAGLELCETETVLFLDDDDRLTTNAVDLLAAALARCPEAAGAAGSYRVMGRVGGPVPLGPRLHVTRPVWPELLFGWNMPPGTVLWRTDVVREIGGWNEDLRSSEDRDLNLRAYPRPFVLLPETVMEYRVHPNQVTSVDRWAEHHERMRAFVADLSDVDRRRGQVILDLAARARTAVPGYEAGDFRPARRLFTQALHPSLGLLTSPILGPWLLAMATKSAVLGAFPPVLADAVRHRRRSEQVG